MRKILVIIVSVLAVMVLAANSALAHYRYFGAWNYHTPAYEQGPAGPLTGVEVDNASCLSQHVGCGLYMCVFARTTWGGIWGGRYCGYGKVYHPYRNVWLSGGFTVYDYPLGAGPDGQYVYGTIFW